MRILVVSDSHGNVMGLRKAIFSQPRAELVIHLGDGEEDVAMLRPHFPEKMFLQVRGNCDWGSTLPAVGEYTAEGVKIFYAHGHEHGVKSGDEAFCRAARKHGARIALYGHTHRQMTNYIDGLYVMNPGAIRGWEASYGIIDITPQGIVTNIISLP